MAHLIQKQIIDLRIQDGSRARAVQERMHGMFRTRALPVMDEVLSAFSFSHDETGETHILIEKLEIDLGRLSEPDLEWQFHDRLKEHLVHALENELARAAVPPAPAPGREPPKTRKIQNRDTLVYFLTHGVLPWWAADSTDLDQMLNRTLETQAEEFVADLSRSPSMTAIERLVKQFSPRTSSRIITTIQGIYPQAGKIISGWLNITQTPDIPGDMEIKIMTRLLYEALKGQPDRISGDHISEVMYRALLDDSASIRRDELAFVRDAQDRLQSTDRLYKWLGNKRDRILSIRSKHKDVFSPGKASENQTGTEARTENRLDSAAGSDETGTRNKPLQTDPNIPGAVHPFNPVISAGATLETVESIEDRRSGIDKGRDDPWSAPETVLYIENGGLVLVWPFLVQYFTTLNLVKDKEFVNDTAREKGVFLLQYLVSGLVFPHEYALLLNKILCGWPLKRPLLRSVDVSPAERRESEEVIRSVIAHWKVLKKTSIDGFRQSFLQREGRLTRAGDHWELKMGRQGIDVLLDDLPWGIGIVRLPWMLKGVYVEW